jgi:hypothetical protein
MGAINLGKSVSQTSIQREEICMAKGEVLGQSLFGIESSFYLHILDTKRRNEC